MPNINKKAGDLVNRVAQLEEEVKRLQALFVTLDQYVAAAAEAVGTDLVNATYRARQRREIDRETAENEASLEEGKRAGYIVTADKIEKRGVVVISEVNGADVYDRSFIFMSRQPPENQAALVGKAVGDEFEAPGGSKVKVLEVYRTDPEKFVAWQREQAAAQQAARSAAANAKAEAEASQEVADGSGDEPMIETSETGAADAS